MAVYEFRCGKCGTFDVRLAIGTAPDRYRCPTCHAVARRAFSPPMLREVSKPVGVVLGGEAQSRDEPAVVSEVPPRGRPAATSAPHPALARLPRP